MANIPKAFPELIKEVRRQLGISQEELAQELGVSFSTINRWENGKTMPSKLAYKQFTTFCTKNTRSGKLTLEEKDATS
jgi:putative transcriptional regulator